MIFRNEGLALVNFDYIYGVDHYIHASTGG